MWAWFSSMYADTDVLRVMLNYRNRGVGGAVTGIFTKRILLSPVWSVVEAIDLPETMQIMGAFGLRVAVPYYRPFRPNFLDTNVFINENQAGKLAEAESIAQLALFEQFLNAESDLKEAIVREILKHTATATLGKSAGSEGLALIGGLLSMMTSAAETRNWLTLPYSIRIQRYALPAGKHKVRLLTNSTIPGVVYNETNQEIEIEAGKISVISSRAVLEIGRQ